MRSSDSERQKSVLIVSYFYPPFQSVGALRVSKITKHLPAFGWRPSVLTVANVDLPRTMDVEIPADSVHRTPALDVNLLPKILLGRERVAAHGFHVARDDLAGRLVATLGETYKRWINFPDGQVGWYPFAVREGLRIIAKDRPRLIYSSALPATCHLISHRLSAITGVPWVAEFRDPWTDNPGYTRPLPLRLLERRLEDRVMSTSSAMVAVTPALAEQTRARFGGPVAMVPNGFDQEDTLTGIPPLETFTVTFTGMVYPGRQSARPLFDALSRLRVTGEVPPGFRVRLVGRNVASIAREADEAGVPEMVESLPQVDRRSALKMQAESTILLLLLWTSDDHAWYPAKMFEYMGAERPILALGPPSNEAARLLIDCGAGVVASNRSEAEQVLRGWFATYRSGGASALKSTSAPPAFDRRRLVSGLADLFDQICGTTQR